MEENNNEKVRKGSLEASEPQEEIVQQEINEQESIQEEKVEEIKEENNENVVEEKADEDKEEIKKEEPKNINIQAKAKKEVKPKKKINKQVILVAIIVIACIVITVGLIILKMRDLNKKYQYVEEKDVFTTEDKVEDPDAIYATDKDTTYNYNDLMYKQIYEADGVIFDGEGREFYNAKEYSFTYVQISGLKDKNVENKINTELKNFLHENILPDSTGVKMAHSSVVGNFSNILSVIVSSNTDRGQFYYGLNYDLNTGEKIPFENLFIKSTPILSILTEAVAQEKAWKIEPGVVDSNDMDNYWKQLQEYYNMENRDTSEYEDLLFKVSNKYNEVKGNVQYAITPFKIFVYNVLPDELATDSNNAAYYIDIPMYRYEQYIAIYKRYAGTDIFENSDIGLKGVRAFSMPMSYYTQNTRKNMVKGSIYGNLTDNVFCDIAVNSYLGEIDEKRQKALDLSKVNIENKINEIKISASQDKENGYVIQGTYGAYNESGLYMDHQLDKYLIPHISVRINLFITKLPKEKYDNLNYYLGELAAAPTASADPKPFYEYRVSQMGGTYTIEYIDLYFDTEGNFLGTDKEQLLDEKRNSQYITLS